MGRELLWRGYPTDQRGTYFRRFWTPEQNELAQDLHRFTPTPLGTHLVDAAGGILVANHPFRYKLDPRFSFINPDGEPIDPDRPERAAQTARALPSGALGTDAPYPSRRSATTT